MANCITPYTVLFATHCVIPLPYSVRLRHTVWSIPVTPILCDWCHSLTLCDLYQLPPYCWLTLLTHTVWFIPFPYTVWLTPFHTVWFIPFPHAVWLMLLTHVNCVIHTILLYSVIDATHAPTLCDLYQIPLSCDWCHSSTLCDPYYCPIPCDWRYSPTPCDPYD